MTLLSNRSRELNIALLNQEPRIIDKHLAQIEQELKKIYAFSLKKISSIDSPDFMPCDLLIVIAHTLDHKSMAQWILSMAKRMERNNNIATPALIIGDEVELAARLLTDFAISENWYFDIVDVKHLESISIRAANLIRIHDHIHELGRYEQAISEMEHKIKALEEKL